MPGECLLLAQRHVEEEASHVTDCVIHPLNPTVVNLAPEVEQKSPNATLNLVKVCVVSESRANL